MKRVVIALDGSQEAQQILPDARRLAGPDGELVLLHESKVILAEIERSTTATPESPDMEDYLDSVATKLRDHGVRVETHEEMVGAEDVARTLGEAATTFHADVIALATHGRGIRGRLVHGGVAWSVLAHSHVPVLIRHIDSAHEFPNPFDLPQTARRILVPLDGSQFAEASLPLAAETAREWGAELVVARVIPDPSMIMQASAWGGMAPLPVDTQEIEDDSREVAAAYLAEVVKRFPGLQVSSHVLEGHVTDQLVHIAEQLAITDVVMSSHGRSGLARVVLGSVADALIQRLHLPLIVIPALAVSLRMLEQQPISATTN
jgi:nucleotide-binding universal stress UspA family protein